MDALQTGVQAEEEGFLVKSLFRCVLVIERKYAKDEKMDYDCI